ncbi:MAG: HAD hydrolase-like protein, partial [Pseudomonadota bacterium]
SLEIDTVFHAVTGGDSFPFKKPDPRHIEETVNAVAGDPRNAVMFGDSENDIVAAQRADIPVIAVDFGYTPQHVSTFSPTRIISDYRALSLQDVADVIADHRAKAG